MDFPKPLKETIDAFARLPGIGKKTAQRLVEFLLRDDERSVTKFGELVSSLRSSVSFCQRCFHITEESEVLCSFCKDASRDTSRICVVEDFIDVFAVENTGTFTGLYHVLRGVISPINGVGPDKLTLESLRNRVLETSPIEVIVATNPTMEGEATALYIKKILSSSMDTVITRIAKGMPVGGDIDYADQVTLGNALSRRTAL